MIVVSALLVGAFVVWVILTARLARAERAADAVAVAYLDSLMAEQANADAAAASYLSGYRVVLHD